MRGIIVAICCLALPVGLVMCKKGTTKTNTALCTGCSTIPVQHARDSTGVFYFLPTAFTPNGDGVNDVFRLLYDSLIADSSSLTIWDMNGVEVFTGNISQRWEGVDLNGKKCPDGQYPVSVKIRTSSGLLISSCACVTILSYTGGCIKTNGINYYFEDQIDPLNGFVFATNDQLCP